VRIIVSETVHMNTVMMKLVIIMIIIIIILNPLRIISTDGLKIIIMFYVLRSLLFCFVSIHSTLPVYPPS